MSEVLKTLKIRVKDNRRNILNRMAFDVNQVWNEANAETSEFCQIPIPEVGYVFNNISAFDLQKQLKGIRKERDMIIGAGTAQEIIAIHAKARKQFKKSKLKWRTSGGARKSLGFVPFKSGAIKWKNGQINFCGYHFKVWDTYGLVDYEFRSGSFSQDARGRWYLSIVVKVKQEQSQGKGQIGIDLGLKTTAVCSDGTTLERKEYYRGMEAKLAMAQRANKKKLIKTIHAKIKNRRADTNHKFTTKLVKENSLIVVGNVSSKAMVKRKKGFAKSVLDAGWYQLKTMLDEKSKRMRVVYLEVNEAYSSMTCSACGCISSSSPRGLKGLAVREWTCADCGTLLSRDINGATNILAIGKSNLALGH